MEHVLLIEDSPEITDLIRLHFEEAGYSLTSCFTAEEGQAVLENKNFSLLILDLMLPGMSGIEFCSKIRALGSKVPIIMLTAKSEEIDCILGLEIGADDYLTKPFSIRELLARAKAILRRTRESTNNQTNNSSEEITLQDLKISPSKREVFAGEKAIELTSKEFDLLLLFAKNPGKCFSRSDLLNEIWGYQYSGYEHTVNSHINRLRNKIEADPNHPKYIATVWGVGYKFNAPN